MMDKFGRETARAMEENMMETTARATQAMDCVADLRQRLKSRLVQQTANEKKLRLVTQQITQAKMQLDEAVNTKDFGLAAQLDAIVEKCEPEKHELDRILEKLERDVKQLNEQQKNAADVVAACFAEVQTKLKEVQESEESAEEVAKQQFDERFGAATEKKLMDKHERLINDMKENREEEARVAENRSNLDSIAEHVASVERKKVDKCQTIQTVEDEVEELRERLAAREAVLNQLKMEEQAYDSEIATAKLGLSRETIEAQEKEEVYVKEERSRLNSEHSNLICQIKNLEEEVEAHSEALLSHDELMETLQTEISLAEELEIIVAKEVVFGSAAIGTNDDGEEDDDSELLQLQNKVVEGEAAVVVANQRVKAAEAVREGLDVEHETLLARIHSLESQEKAAAGRRDFEAAEKAKKEIKVANRALEDYVEDYEEASDRVRAAKEELEQLQTDLASKKAAMNEKDKEQGEAAMAKLAKTIRCLISTKKKFCGNASKNSVKAVGETVLSCRIKTLQKEGETYGDKLGGWTEIIEKIYEEEEDDDSKPASKEELESKASEKEPDESSEEGGGDASKAGKDDGSELSKAKISKLKELTQRLKDAEESREAAVDESSEEGGGDASKAGKDDGSELSKAKISKLKELTQRLKDAEESREAAVEREDYDEPAELDVVFQEIQKKDIHQEYTDGDGRTKVVHGQVTGYTDGQPIGEVALQDFRVTVQDRQTSVSRKVLYALASGEWKWYTPEWRNEEMLDNRSGVVLPQLVITFRGFSLEFTVQKSTIPGAGYGVFASATPMVDTGGEESFELEVGELLDLGIYAPWQPDDRKKECVFFLKNYIHSYKCEEWCFDTNDGDDSIFDATDDITGDLHELAGQHIPAYVNECGPHDVPKIRAEHDPEGNVHYLLGVVMGKKLRILGDGVKREVFIDYGTRYESVRVRKGYSTDDGLAEKSRELECQDDEYLSNIEGFELKDICACVEWLCVLLKEDGLDRKAKKRALLVAETFKKKINALREKGKPIPEEMEQTVQSLSRRPIQHAFSEQMQMPAQLSQEDGGQDRSDSSHRSFSSHKSARNTSSSSGDKWRSHRDSVPRSSDGTKGLLRRSKKGSKTLSSREKTISEASVASSSSKKQVHSPVRRAPDKTVSRHCQTKLSIQEERSGRHRATSAEAQKETGTSRRPSSQVKKRSRQASGISSTDRGPQPARRRKKRSAGSLSTKKQKSQSLNVADDYDFNFGVDGGNDSTKSG